MSLSKQELLLSSVRYWLREIGIFLLSITTQHCAQVCCKEGDDLWGEGSDKNSDTIRVVVNIRYKEGSIDLGDNVEQVVAESVDKS